MTPGPLGRRSRRSWRGLRSAVRLSPAGIWAIVRCVALAALVEVAVRLAPLPRAARLMGLALDFSEPMAAPSSAAPSPRLSAREERDVRATLRVMRRWPFTSSACLRQALVLGHVLRGRRPVLRLGVGGADDRVTGHAWIEVEGTSIGADDAYLPLLANGAHGSR